MLKGKDFYFGTLCNHQKTFGAHHWWSRAATSRILKSWRFFCLGHGVWMMKNCSLVSTCSLPSFAMPPPHFFPAEFDRLSWDRIGGWFQVVCPHVRVCMPCVCDGACVCVWAMRACVHICERTRVAWSAKLVAQGGCCWVPAGGVRWPRPLRGVQSGAGPVLWAPKECKEAAPVPLLWWVVLPGRCAAYLSKQYAWITTAKEVHPWFITYFISSLALWPMQSTQNS